MRSLLKIAVAGAIVTSTYYAIVRIAEHKADALAGGGTYLIDGRHAAEGEALDALSARLRDWAVASALDSAAAARETATGAPDS